MGYIVVAVVAFLIVSVVVVVVFLKIENAKQTPKCVAQIVLARARSQEIVRVHLYAYVHIYEKMNITYQRVSEQTNKQTKQNETKRTETDNVESLKRAKYQA